MAPTKEQRIAALGTLIFSICFIIMLMLLSFTIPEQKPEEQGILINFGDSEVGTGEIEPMIADADAAAEEQVNEQTVQPTVTPHETADAVGEEDVETQNFEDAAVIEKQKKDAEKKQQEEALERQKQQELENQRLAEIAQQEKIAREQRQQRQRDSIGNVAKNAFAGRNPNGGIGGEGEGKGEGNQGALNGDINSKNREGGGTGGNGGGGIEFSLTGRSYGSAPPKPIYKSKAEGKVVVEINVDRNGTVISARPGVQGTTTSDKTLHEAAKEAALKAKFDSNPNAPAVQKGTITYIFILQ